MLLNLFQSLLLLLKCLLTVIIQLLNWLSMILELTFYFTIRIPETHLISFFATRLLLYFLCETSFHVRFSRFHIISGSKVSRESLGIKLISRLFNVSLCQNGSIIIHLILVSSYKELRLLLRDFILINQILVSSCTVRLILIAKLCLLFFLAV